MVVRAVPNDCFMRATVQSSVDGEDSGLLFVRAPELLTILRDAPRNRRLAEGDTINSVGLVGGSKPAELGNVDC